jgi:hypothetical protein
LAFFAALAVRLPLWLNLAPHPQALLRPDSFGYLQPARNLVEHHVYSDSERPPWLPGAQHAPGYPAFLAAHLLVSRNLLLPSASQVFLDAGTAALVAIAAASLSTHPAIWLVGLLYALDPVAAAHCPLILSEALFNFLLTLALVLLLRAGPMPARGTMAAGAGLCLGAAIWVRPIAVYLWLPWSLALAWVYPPRGRRFAGYFAAGAILFTTCWCARNKAVLGDFSYNPVRSADTLLYEAAAVQAYVDHSPEDVERRRLHQEVQLRHSPGPEDPIEEARIARQLSLAILRAHPGHVLRLYPVSLLKLFWSPGLDIVTEVLWPGGLIPADQSAPYRLAGHGTRDALARRPLLWAVLVLGLLVLTLLYGLALLGLRILWQRRQPFAVVACLVPVAYLVIVSSGGWVYYRHRIPILPLLAAFDSIALGELLPRPRQPEARAPQLPS